MSEFDEYIAEEKDTEIYKCPSCGGNLEFCSETQNLQCPNCGTIIDFEKTSGEQTFALGELTENNTQWQKDTHIYRCNNCGASEIVDKLAISQICPYCGSTNIIETDELAGLQPNAVLPFKISKDDARRSFNEWLKKRWFKPNNLIATARINEFRGVYSPVFLYNTNTFSDYYIRYGKNYIVTVGSGKNRRTEVRTRYYSARGKFNRNFADFMIEASAFLDQKTQDKLKPFETNQASKYDKKFLAGFSASSHNISVDEGFSTARSSMEQIIKSEIVAKYNADVVSEFRMKTNYYGTTYRYMLLPIFLSNYRYNQKNYNFYVNGTNAKVVGKVPRSAWKITFFSLGVVALFATAYFVYKMYAG